MVTNYIKGASYKEIYDLHTDSESTSILTIHSPVSNFPRKVLSGFFNQYRKFKYLGCRVSIRPASRLPADPAQLSYAAGEPEIDARDMLNPVLYRGYSGESLGYFLNIWNSPGKQTSTFKETQLSTPEVRSGSGFFGDTIDKTSFPENAVGFSQSDWRATYLEKLYYQSLSDPHFKKMAPQKGMSKFFYPLVYELATTTQRLSNTAYDGQYSVPDVDGIIAYKPDTANHQTAAANLRKAGGDIDACGDGQRNAVSNSHGSGQTDIENSPEITLYSYHDSGDTTKNIVRYMRKTVPILTSHKRRLGWLDTDTRVVRPYKYGDEVRSIYPDNATSVFSPVGTSINLFPENSRTRQLFPNEVVQNTTLPLINMGIIALPKSYKTEMYFRVTCQHFFDFKGYRPTYGLVSPFDTTTLDGPTLEWNDWDDDQYVFPSASLTSTSKNVDLVDVSQ